MKAARSLASRLSLLQQLATVAVVATFAASSLWITQRTLQREERTLLLETAGRLADSIDRELQEEGDLAQAAADVMEEETGTNLRIEIRDAAGVLLASSIRAARDTTTATVDLDEDTGEIARATVTSPAGARITVSTSTRLRDASMAALGRALLLTAAPLLLVALFVSRWITRRALRPLAEMGRRAHDAASAQGTRSIGPAYGLTEIDELRASFDRLLGRLDDLLQSERRFTADASHELRTPLTVLSGELEAALARPDIPVEARPGITRAAEQVRTMRDLVEALLLLRRTGPDREAERQPWEFVNLADLAREVAREAGLREPGRTGDLALEAPDEVLVSGQPALLASAVRNLVDNAYKFTSTGQAIRIAVADAGGESETASIRVDDAGPGIPPVERERVFDPFYRGAEARANHGGMGLGLPILRQVARAHGGDVTITESPLGGARVTLRLPAVTMQAPPSSSGDIKAPGAHSRGSSPSSTFANGA